MSILNKSTQNQNEFFKKITQNELSLEQILQNNIICQTDIKMKFSRVAKFFLKEEIINKLIDYCLSYDSSIIDYEHFSHNSCEILSNVKNTQLHDFLLSSIEINNEEKFRFMDRIFEKIHQTMTRNEKEINKEMVSGYFKRVFLNIMLCDKEGLLNYLFNNKKSLDYLIYLSNINENFQLCLYSIITSNINFSFNQKVSELMNDLLDKYLINEVDISDLLYIILCERNNYIKLFLNNQQLYEKLIITMTMKLSNNTSQTIIDKQSSPIVNRPKVAFSCKVLNYKNEIKSNLYEKHTINNKIIEPYKALCRNIMIDLTNIKSRMNTKSIKERGLGLVIKDQLNSEDENKTKLLISRKIQLKNENLEDDIEENPDEDVEESLYNILSIYKIFTYLKKCFNSIFLHLLGEEILQKKYFGFENLKKVEVLVIIYEIFVNMNFIKVKYDEYAIDNPTIDMGNKISDEVYSKISSPILYNSVKVYDLISFLFNSVMKFEGNNILHLEIQYFFELLMSEYSPQEFIDSFIENDFLKNLIEYTESSYFPKNLSNICHIYVSIFTSSNSFIEKYIFSSKFFNLYVYTLNTIYS